MGRFTQPDTIVPVEVQGTQAWDRFAYVNNNPVRYNDPSGHCIGPLLVACVAVAGFIAENAGVIGTIAVVGVIASFIGDSNADHELVFNEEASQAALNQSVNQAALFVGAAEGAFAFASTVNTAFPQGPSSATAGRPDLYRNGGPDDPNYKLYTPDKPNREGDFDIFVDENGNVGPGGGLSTRSEPQPWWKRSWTYPSDAPDPEGIRIFQDDPTDPAHWLWEPAWEMPLAQFKRFLKDTRGDWVPPQ